MTSYNKVLIMGNLTRDVEMQYTPGGDAVAKFSVAVTEKYKDKETTAFIDVTVWRKQAENCAKFISKGSCVLVDGKWCVDTWDDKETGKKRQKAYVTAMNVTFVTKPLSQEQQQQTQPVRQEHNQDQTYKGEFNQDQRQPQPQNNQPQNTGIQPQDNRFPPMAASDLDPNSDVAF